MRAGQAAAAPVGHRAGHHGHHGQWGLKPRTQEMIGHMQPHSTLASDQRRQGRPTPAGVTGARLGRTVWLQQAASDRSTGGRLGAAQDVGEKLQRGTALLSQARGMDNTPRTQAQPACCWLLPEVRRWARLALGCRPQHRGVPARPPQPAAFPTASQSGATAGDSGSWRVEKRHRPSGRGAPRRRRLHGA